MKRRIGTLFVVLGTVLLLAALALLVYNQREADQAQQASSDVLEQLQDVLADQTSKNPLSPDEYEDLAEKRQTAGSETTEDDAEVPDMTTVMINGREYIGYISVPSVGLALPVMSEWSYAGLKIAPGRYSGNVFSRDLVIAGHNYARHFSPIKWLNEGDAVEFVDMDGTKWEYEVSRVEIVKPTDIEGMITETEDDLWDLTLFTCTTGGKTRCAVRCQLVTDEDTAG